MIVQYCATCIAEMLHNTKHRDSSVNIPLSPDDSSQVTQHCIKMHIQLSGLNWPQSQETNNITAQCCTNKYSDIHACTLSWCHHRNIHSRLPITFTITDIIYIHIFELNFMKIVFKWQTAFRKIIQSFLGKRDCKISKLIIMKLTKKNTTSMS